MNPFDALLPQPADDRAHPPVRLGLGTVTAALAVTLADGATVTPAASLVALVSGDRVLVARQARRLYVLGKVQ